MDGLTRAEMKEALEPIRDKMLGEEMELGDWGCIITCVRALAQILDEEDEEYGEH